LSGDQELQRKEDETKELREDNADVTTCVVLTKLFQAPQVEEEVYSRVLRGKTNVKRGSTTYEETNYDE
jgi:hypothetical protein